jgi:lipopolysaccharide/colanic/teichoic acid biosynthesis glycosyltransferase
VENGVALDHGIQRFLKRAMDVVLSAGGLVLLSPVMAAIALAIRLDSRGPVIYRHGRIGQGGRTTCTSFVPWSAVGTTRNTKNTCAS